VKHRAMTSAVFELIQTFEFDRSGHLRCNWDTDVFEATSPNAARQLVEEALLAFLEHSAGEPIA